ncbi:Ubiquitin carboxyl-terminal hydrolase [Trichinella spiralis]|uniref:Ubiquitin carboxyl-terminal hydrolase n=1 Tax=Trichinella spiralis TaxID=6334 RepID=A0ABR3KGX6_TRISP
MQGLSAIGRVVSKQKDVMEPEHGYLKDDTLILEVHLVADAPHGVQWTARNIPAILV